MAEQLQLGYGPSAHIFGALIAVVTTAYYAFRVNAVLAFWAAYVLTHPFGASCDDLLSQPTTAGGLGLGTVGTSSLFLIVIPGLVALLTVDANRSGSVPRGASHRPAAQDWQIVCRRHGPPNHLAPSLKAADGIPPPSTRIEEIRL